jgi:CheY-like chemotaxis protein
MSRQIIAAVDDLFFASKIRAVAEHLGVSIKFARSDQAVRESLSKETPDLIILDLHSQKVPAVVLAKEIKADERLGKVKLVGFFSHVETQLAEDAKQAGFDQVLPRSAFTNRLAEILGDNRRADQ